MLRMYLLQIGFNLSDEMTEDSVYDSLKKASELIREDDEVVYGDSGYQGIEKREEIKTDPNKSKMDY